MIPVLLIPWAALAICLPIVKAAGVAERVIHKRKVGQRPGPRDVVDAVREVQAAENEAYTRVAKGLCGAVTELFGAPEPPEVVVKGVSLAFKGVTRVAKPSLSELTNGRATDHAGR